MIDLDFWQFPLSVLTAAAFVVAVVICGLRVGKDKLPAFLAGREFTVMLLASATVLCMVEGTWKLQIFRTWGFLFVVALMMFSLGLVTVDGIRRSLPAGHVLSHLGMFLMLFGGFFGAPDVTEAMLVAEKGRGTDVACTGDGRTVRLPFELSLKDFTVTFHDDGVSPRQYTSTLLIGGEEYTTSVNHPLKHMGYRIHQSDYDKERGEYSVLKIVRDPWLPVVFLGMALLALSAFMGMKLAWKSRFAVPVMLGLAVIFALISLARIRFGTLMPALRSLWFVPHLIIYMLAYSLLALSLVSGVFALCGREGAAGLSCRLLKTASSLLITGMLCGAVWAQAAWGDWWTWDAKECWAAATWMITLVGTHLPGRRFKAVFIVTLLAFAAMQMTWYGVNCLPSAAYSLHTYFS